MADNSAFKQNFAALLKKAGGKAEEVVRQTAITLQNGMIEKSPVLTGRFKNNWQSSTGSINTDTSASADKTGAGALNRTITTLQGWKPGQTIFLSNSLPYARRLEYSSWSNQAPNGMVRLTVQEYGDYLKKAVSELK